MSLDDLPAVKYASANNDPVSDFDLFAAAFVTVRLVCVGCDKSKFCGKLYVFCEAMLAMWGYADVARQAFEDIDAV